MGKVWAEGKYLGEIEDSRDRQKNIAAMEALRAAHGLPPTLRKTLPQRACDQAKSFAEAAKLIREQPLVSPDGRNLVAPSVVNSAFAIELYLKAIGFSVARNLHGHKLEKLFGKLPAEIQHKIQAEYAVVADRRGTRAYPVVNMLREKSEAFEKWRYPYQQKGTLAYYPDTDVILLEALDCVCRLLAYPSDSSSPNNL